MPQPPNPWRSRFGPEEGEAQARPAGQAEAAAPPQAPGRAPSELPPDADGVLQFSPERVILAIAYHVLEEGLAREVAAPSMSAAVNRLRRRSVRPAIRRSAWLAMTNHDRLEWLLAESRSVPLIGEDDVMLLGSRDV